MGNEIIYLDNAATTKPFDSVLAAMNKAEAQGYFNSATPYAGGVSVAKAVLSASEEVAKIISSAEGEVVWTSGATESNNMVLFGLNYKTGDEIVVSSLDHSSVIEPARELEGRGVIVKYIKLTKGGGLDLNDLAEKVCEKTRLVVLSFCNGETGTKVDLNRAAEIIRAKNPKTHLHLDFVQGFMKFDFDCEKFSSATISAHKINGPKGVGALWIKKGVKIKPLIFGGHQQNLRAGTINNPAIFGFRQAIAEWAQNDFRAKVSKLHKTLITNLPSGVETNGDNDNPFITSLRFEKLLGATVLNALSARGIFVGLGSACSSNAKQNRVLSAMGISAADAKKTIRVSLGAYNTEAEILNFCEILSEIIKNYSL
ncbi:MAG: cysteine desulfurase [Christensenellaceae bacterium]|nr:cysteine desulfurase [Christensenellaceae bacterium]